jgi:hypothetical protein
MLNTYRSYEYISSTGLVPRVATEYPWHVVPVRILSYTRKRSILISKIVYTSLYPCIQSTASLKRITSLDLPTMKFRSAVAGLFAVLGCTDVSAFSPRNVVANKSGLMVPSASTLKELQQQSPLWRPPMNMVAGGAERAYGQEYYEGAWIASNKKYCSCVWCTILCNISCDETALRDFTHTFPFPCFYRRPYRATSRSSFAVVAQSHRVHWNAFSASRD